MTSTPASVHGFPPQHEVMTRALTWDLSRASSSSSAPMEAWEIVIVLPLLLLASWGAYHYVEQPGRVFSEKVAHKVAGSEATGAI